MGNPTQRTAQWYPDSRHGGERPVHRVEVLPERSHPAAESAVFHRHVVQAVVLPPGACADVFTALFSKVLSPLKCDSRLV